MSRAINISFIDVSQTNDIGDPTYWGSMGSNYSKNLLFDTCTLSRFDAHMGVANATMRNSTLGHRGINAIGSGTFIAKNSEIRGRSLINIRSDYGSTWQGKLIIWDCTFLPAGGKTANTSLISGYNISQHDFGYTCYMPKTITITNFHIDDSNHPEGFLGPTIFANFALKMNDNSFKDIFPYVIPEEVTLENVTTCRNMVLRVSNNTWIFKGVKVKKNKG
jgi:hypothetical protein